MKKGIRLVLFLFILLGMKEDNLIMAQSHQILNDSLALHYLVRKPLVPTEKAKAIVLLHGVGSNEEDLFSLAGHFPEDYYIISARGKFTLSEGSYAWYQVDFSSGRPIYNPAQELESRQAILLFLSQVKAKYGLEEIYMGGFSQGAIMSYGIGLLNPEKVKGIFCLSGRMLEEVKEDMEMSPELQQLRIFVAHGTQDRVLPIQYSREANAFLISLGLEVSYHEYKMGHEVIGEELRELKEWLISK